jgi:hypothetical protein
VYARFLQTEPEYVEDDSARNEAVQMQNRADEIFQRLRVSIDDHSRPGA